MRPSTFVPTLLGLPGTISATDKNTSVLATRLGDGPSPGEQPPCEPPLPLPLHWRLVVASFHFLQVSFPSAWRAARLRHAPAALGLAARLDGRTASARLRRLDRGSTWTRPQTSWTAPRVPKHRQQGDEFHGDARIHTAIANTGPSMTRVLFPAVPPPACRSTVPLHHSARTNTRVLLYAVGSAARCMRNGRRLPGAVPSPTPPFNPPHPPHTRSATKTKGSARCRPMSCLCPTNT